MLGHIHLSRRQKYYLASLVLQVFLSAFLVYHWDGFVFAQSVKDFLHGITPYQLVDNPAPLYTYHSHQVPWWYAYPPLPLLMMTASYGPAFLLFGSNAMVARIFIALPSVLGNLLCAHLVYKMIAGTVSKEYASRAEKLILFNPFLILIAAVRGMFDIWMVDFLLMGLLSLRRQRYSLSAVFFGMGILIKPIVAVFLPILVIYVWNKSGRGFFSARFLGLVLLTVAIICLPFFLLDPGGFIYQVAGMHWARPPSGYTLSGLLYMGHASIISTVISSMVSSLLSILLMVSILVIAAYLRFKRTARESSLVAALLLAILLFTFFSKVANPQYFVIPVVLTVLLLYGYRSYNWFTRADLRRYYKWMVIPFTGATLLNDGLYYGLLPHDIAMTLLHKTGAQLELQFVNNLPFSSGLYYLLLSICSGLLVVPAFTLSFFMCYKAFKSINRVVIDYIHTFLADRGLLISKASMIRGISIPAAGLMVAIPLAAGWISYHHAVASESPPPAPLEDKLTGVFYYYWWHNSTHDPEIQSDNWLASQLTPDDGYYDLGPAYMKADIESMKQAGIDFAVASYGNIYPKRYDMFVDACEDESFYFAPMIELHDFAIDQPSQVDPAMRLDEKTKKEIIGRIDAVLARRDSPCYLTYRDRPVLFVHTTPYFPYNQDLQERGLFWSEIKTEIEAKYGEIFWVTDCGFSDYASPDNNSGALFMLPGQASLDTLDGETATETWENCSEEIMQLSGGLRIATVFPYYDDFEVDVEARQKAPLESAGESSIYNLTWQKTIDSDPDMVLIYSWNQYFEGACIEPTAEFGNLFLEQTGSWIDEFKQG